MPREQPTQTRSCGDTWMIPRFTGRRASRRERRRENGRPICSTLIWRSGYGSEWAGMTFPCSTPTARMSNQSGRRVADACGITSGGEGRRCRRGFRRRVRRRHPRHCRHARHARTRCRRDGSGSAAMMPEPPKFAQGFRDRHGHARFFAVVATRAVPLPRLMVADIHGPPVKRRWRIAARSSPQRRRNPEQLPALAQSCSLRPELTRASR